MPLRPLNEWWIALIIGDLEIHAVRILFLNAMKITLYLYTDSLLRTSVNIYTWNLKAPSLWFFRTRFSLTQQENNFIEGIERERLKKTFPNSYTIKKFLNFLFFNSAPGIDLLWN